MFNLRQNHIYWRTRTDVLVLLSGQWPQKKKHQWPNTLCFGLTGNWIRGSLQHIHLSPADLDFGGEKDALSFTVRRWNGLQLQEVQQNLDLRRRSRHYRDTVCTARKTGRERYLCHDLQRPAVPHVNGLRGVGRNLTVLLWWPQQCRPKHCSQIVERHFIDALLLCHPEDNTFDLLNCSILKNLILQFLKLQFFSYNPE